MLCLYLKILKIRAKIRFFRTRLSILARISRITQSYLPVFCRIIRKIYISLLLGAYDDKRIVIFLKIILRQHIFLQQSGIDNENIFTFLRDMIGP